MPLYIKDWESNMNNYLKNPIFAGESVDNGETTKKLL